MDERTKGENEGQEPYRNAEVLKRHQWRKGQSGNPKGRPPGRSLTDRLAAALNADDGRIAGEIVEALIRQALKGRRDALRDIFDRIDGKPTARVELSGPDGDAIKVAACEVRAKIEAQLDDDECDPDESG